MSTPTRDPEAQLDVEVDPDVDDPLDRLVEAIDRIADGLAGIADAFNRWNDRQAFAARDARKEP